MTNYLFNFNSGQYDNKAIHDGIVNTKLIGDWWHYLPNTYIFSTESSSKAIADEIMKKFPGLLFFIVKIDLQDTNGVLKKEAWDWVNKKTANTLKLKVIPQSTPKPISLSSLFSSPTKTVTNQPFKSVSDILKDFDI